MTLVYLMQRTVLDARTNTQIATESYIMTAKSEERLGTDLPVPQGQERKIADLLLRTMQQTDDLILAVHPKLQLEERLNGYIYRTGPMRADDEIYRILQEHGAHFYR
jgi:hypothetical protein